MDVHILGFHVEVAPRPIATALHVRRGDDDRTTRGDAGEAAAQLLRGELEVLSIRALLVWFWCGVAVACHSVRGRSVERDGGETMLEGRVDEREGADGARDRRDDGFTFLRSGGLERRRRIIAS